jgi:thymidylate synthase
MKSDLVEPRGCAGFESMDEVQHWVLATILEHGRRVAPRNEPTLERLAVNFTLRQPRRRCILNAERHWSLPLAIGEFCWHLAGSDDVTFLSYYAKRWAEFAGNGSTIEGSCYGYKAFSGQPSLWEQLLQLLRFDSDSRRALLVFQNPGRVFDVKSVDVACASTLQFFVRDRKVTAVCTMRSNDAIWGLPYDVFLFTMMQELLACQLGLELGEYHHSAGSMHLYQRHLELSRRICAEQVAVGFEMPAMRACEQLSDFLEAESRIRTGRVDETVTAQLDPYWEDLLTVLRWFGRVKRGVTSESKDPLLSGSPYKRLVSLVRI